MLRITKAEDQALRLAMRLAAAGGQVTLGELARQENLPEPMVAKLLGKLRRGGIVAAVRGRNGGYELAASPDRISAAQVLVCVGADPVRLLCAGRHDRQASDCPREGDCGLRSVWRLLQRQVAQVLQGTSLSDLLLAESENRRRVEGLWALGAPRGQDEPEPTPERRGERSPGADHRRAARAAREGAES